MTGPVYPNLVLAGFPKCGTSSVFEWLCLHPEVCGSMVKETNFLFDEPRPDAVAYHRHGLEAYGRFFPAAPRERVIIEATPRYATQETPPTVLATLPSKPRVLFVVREPGARIRSQFRYLKYNLHYVDEDESFAGWLESDVGKSNIEATRYRRHLARWVERLGKERVRVQVFEEMVRAPAREMGRLCAWLGLDAAFFEGRVLTPRNRTQRIERPGLHGLAQRFGAVLPRSLVNRLLPAWYRLVAQPAEPAAEGEAAALEALRARFEQDNRRLSEDFDLDLSAWAPATGSAAA